MFSIITTYYNNPGALDWQLRQLEDYADLGFELVVVDDGSEGFWLNERLLKTPLSGKLVRINRDIPWNLPGARNWGFVAASNPNCLSIDLDHRPTGETLKELAKIDSMRGRAFLFARKLTSGETIHPHTDTFFLDRMDYWQIGGYDERFSGSYGQNAREFGERAHQAVDIIQTELEIESKLELKTQSLNRNRLRNLVKLSAIKFSPSRNQKRLGQNVTIVRF